MLGLIDMKRTLSTLATLVVAVTSAPLGLKEMDAVVKKRLTQPGTAWFSAIVDLCRAD
jgi:hypothetical protein